MQIAIVEYWNKFPASVRLFHIIPFPNAKHGVIMCTKKNIKKNISNLDLLGIIKKW